MLLMIYLLLWRSYCSMQLRILPIFQRVLCYNILSVNFMSFRALRGKAMATYPYELAQDAACQSHTGRLTGFWFLLKRPKGWILMNEWGHYIYRECTKFETVDYYSRMRCVYIGKREGTQTRMWQGGRCSSSDKLQYKVQYSTNKEMLLSSL
jgi:hypothetical protein